MTRDRLMHSLKMTTTAAIVFVALASVTAKGQGVVYEGTDGVGHGKHIVFLAGDHEYRSEESLPALARILAKHHGFKCTVLFDVDKETGEIVPGNSNMPGMEALDTADLAVVFLRFQDFPAEQMRHFDDYLNRGGPVVGLRTATHAFRMKGDEPFAKYSFDFKGPDYELGFGHQVLGQTWVGHYGRNHQQSTRITVVDGKQNHPILRGVKDVWVQAGAYVGKPTDGDILTMAQPLNGMTPDSPADETKPPMPSEWTRTYKSASGKSGRVFTSLYGTPEDHAERRLSSAAGQRLLLGAGPGRFDQARCQHRLRGTVRAEHVWERQLTRAASSRKPTPVSRVPFRPTTIRKIRMQRRTIAKRAKPNAQPSVKDEAKPLVTGKPARFVRIELPGDKRILTLAEVEVFSAGRNIAAGGKATQSSTHGGAAWRRGRSTATRIPTTASKGRRTLRTRVKRIRGGNSTSVRRRTSRRSASGTAEDLKADWPASRSRCWTRIGNEVFRATDIAAPQVMEIDVKNGGKLNYLTYDGKPGKPARPRSHAWRRVPASESEEAQAGSIAAGTRAGRRAGRLSRPAAVRVQERRRGRHSRQRSAGSDAARRLAGDVAAEPTRRPAGPLPQHERQRRPSERLPAQRRADRR